MRHGREQMRRIGRIGLICGMLCAPSTAWADGIFTPFVGGSFASDDTDKVTTWGLSLATMAGGVFGFELDFGRTATATAASVFVENSRVTTVTGNLIAGVPVKRVRPYIVGGLGWIRTDVTATADSEGVRDGGFGVDVGGGLMGFLGESVGVRVDVRHVRTVKAGEGFRDFEFDGMRFWRASVGLALRF